MEMHPQALGMETISPVEVLGFLVVILVGPDVKDADSLVLGPSLCVAD